MNIEEKFKEEVKIILQVIKKQYLVTLEGQPVEIRIPMYPRKEYGMDSDEEVIKVIYKIEEQKGFKVKEIIDVPILEKACYLEILEPQFDKVYKKYCERETYLTCGELIFDANNGNTTYNKTETNFKPGTDEYKILKSLMEKPNKRLSYDEINIVLGKSGNFKMGNRDISFIVRNVKSKLEIIGKNRKRGNKNLFKGSNGYLINCK